MARFTIRIELHEATWDDYVAMYDHLAGYGITDILTSDDGVKYKMPPAEYNYEGNSTRSEVLESAKKCAAKVVKSYAILVTESAGRTWNGLGKV